MCSLPVGHMIPCSCFSENVLNLGFKATDVNKRDAESATPPHVRQEALGPSRIALDLELKIRHV